MDIQLSINDIYMLCYIFLFLIILKIIISYLINIFDYIKFCKNYYDIKFTFKQAFMISLEYNKKYLLKNGLIRLLAYLIN